MTVRYSFLSNLDIVGISPQILYDGKTKYKSNLGGIFTIIISTLVILAIIGFGEDIYKRKNTSIALNNEFISPFMLTNTTRIIGFRLFLDGLKDVPEIDRLIDPFDLTSVVESTSTNAIVTRHELINYTDSSIFKNNYLNVTTFIPNPAPFYCLNDTFSVDLKGKYGSPVNSHMHLRIAVCKNTTENNNKCFPDYEIRKRLKNFFVSFAFVNTYVDGKDFEFPVKSYLTSDTIKSTANAYTRKI